MSSRILALAALELLLCGYVRADDSCVDQRPAISTGTSAIDERINKNFSTGQFECGVQEITREAFARSPLDGAAGWDSRFALRELALEISKSEYPQAQRLAALRAVVSPSLKPDTPRRSEDLTADSRMLFDASDFITDCSAHFQLLDLVVRINRRLSGRDDAIRCQVVELCNARDSRGMLDEFRGFDDLLVLEKDTRDDPSFGDWRSSIAASAHFVLGASTVTQAEQALALVQALGDVKQCQNCGSDWRWRPVFGIATFYHAQQMPVEASATLHQALEMIRAVPNPNERLLAFKDVCAVMQQLRYPDEDYLPLIQEIKPLAASVDSMDAIELQKRLETNNCVPADSWAVRRP